MDLAGATPASRLLHTTVSAQTNSDGEATQELQRIDDSHKALLLGDIHTTDTHTDRRGPAIVTGQLSGTFLQAGHSDSARDIFCYRRNLFQLRGAIILQQQLIGGARPIAVRASISATENLRGDSVTLITVPKSAKDASNTGSGLGAPGPIEIGLPKEGDCFTPIPFSWSRLQFRSATAKGGRRKEFKPEQHFIVHLRVHAVFADGSETILAEKTSGPVIVRGRSPGNFPSTVKAAQPQGQTVQSAMPSAIDCPDETPLQFDFADFGADVDSQTVDGAGCLLEQFNVLDDFSSHSPGLGFQRDEFAATDISDIFTQELLSHDQNGVDTISISPHSLHSSQMTSKSDVTPATGDSDYSYKYIPLSLDDRTPPVQAVYVSVTARCFQKSPPIDLDYSSHMAFITK
ncbi:hypothetical protein NQ176_g5995 [Zarea fungicola]|uniref:Uncharacterized protein n=1 Tax=Zarea fungicola TaxID=93591 RepID=A0ACC1N7T8_9HYPO|nr:hypothetical protein NQ176_g5995 [Lecanicillium fungicola]